MLHLVCEFSEYSLAQSGADYVLTTPDQTEEVFNSTGQLQTVTKPNGYQQTLSYNPNGTVSKVTDSHGRELNFEYHSAVPLLSKATDPNGDVTLYHYLFAPHRLTRVLYPDNTPGTETNGPEIAYHYEDSEFPSYVTGITDVREDRRYATYEYDSQGRATVSEHAGGADRVAVTYNLNGTATVTNALGKQATYTFATVQGIEKVTRIDGLASSNCPADNAIYAYDGNGYVNSVTDREGNITTYVNDVRGLPTSMTEGSGTAVARTTTTTWHTTYRLPTQIVAPNLTTTFAYDADGNLLTRTQTDTTGHSVPYVTNGQTRTWTFTYTTDGQLATADGPLAGTGDTVTYTYDTDGFLTQVTDALGHITNITAVNGRGQPTSITDPNGVVTTFDYNPRGLLETITVDPGVNASVTRFRYDGVGLITGTVLPDGTSLDYGYDAARRLISIKNGLGEEIAYTRDAMGNITKEDVKTNGGTIRKTVTRTFDELGRILTLVGVNSRTTTYAYNKNDRITSVTDPRGNATSNSFDAVDRLITITNALSDTADIGYNDSDDMTGVTDERGLTTAFVHNGFGDIIRRTSPDTGITDYEYDAAGNLTKMTDARGIVTNYGYDNGYRRTSKTFPANPSENVTYSYDDTTAGNKGTGRLTQVGDASGSTSFVYDARGNVVTATRVIGGQSYVTEYAYDTANRLVEMTYPSGRIVAYAHDGDGRVEAVTTRKTAASSEVVVVSNILYQPFGPIAGMRLGNGLETTFGHDSDYRLTSIDTTDGTTAVEDLDYVYGDVGGDAGSIRSITDNLATSRNQSFDYDVIYRLTQAIGAYGTMDYAYDAVGNRTSRTITTGSVVTETLTYATTSNRLLTVNDGSVTRTLTYSANGNAITDSQGAGLTFAYSNDNRMTTVSQGGTTLATYTYNDRGERVVKDLGGGNVTHYHFDLLGVLIAESDDTGAVIREYIHLGGLPLAVIDAGASTTPTTVTVDNDSVDASSTGTWSVSTAGANFEGANHAEAVGGDGTGFFTWTPPLAAPNEYQVYAKWPSGLSRASTATYTVHHAGGTTDVAVDQRDDGGAYFLLGTFTMVPGQNHRVVLSDLADIAQDHDIVIDNTHPETAETGTWIERTWLGGGQFWGPNYIRMNVADVSAKFTWPASPVPERGVYRVFARWSATYDPSVTFPYATDADYTINHVGGSTTVTVGQRGSGGQWVSLGDYELEPNDNALVELSGFDNNGWLSADAIRIIRLKETGVDFTVDNQDPEATITSGWVTSPSLGGGMIFGSDYRAVSSGSGSETATWDMNVPASGQYRVYARWVTNSARGTNIPYTIFHDGGSSVVTKNQRVDGGEWNLLGVYSLSPGSNHRVVVTNNANGSVSADAVRVVLHTTTATEFEVDNTAATVSGSWGTGTAYGEGGSLGLYRGTNWRFSNGGAGANTVTWPVNVPSAGKYRLYTRWTDGANRNPNTPYVVHHDGGTTMVTVDQRTQGNIWMPLGQFDLSPGAGQQVVLSDLGSGFVIADAIRVVPVEMDAHTVNADAVRFVENDAEDLLYVHADHLGAPRKMTDASRVVVWDAAFTPFGEAHALLGTAANDNRFPGQYFDGETGFHYNYQRDYDPATGRYIQSDPIGLAGGLNTYGYALGNPVRYTDPEGLNPAVGCVAGLPFGGLIGCGAGATIGTGLVLFGGLVAIMSTPGDTAQDTEGTHAESCQEDDDDKCQPLYDQIKALADELRRRFVELRADDGEFYTTRRTGRMSWVGHQDQILGVQRRLRRFLNEADTRGCTEYDPDAWYLATRPVHTRPAPKSD